MILDGIELNYYNENVIWYEYGSGISTSRENKWSKLLFNELMAVNEIIMDRKDSYSKFGKKYSKYLMKEKKLKLFKHH